MPKSLLIIAAVALLFSCSPGGKNDTASRADAGAFHSLADFSGKKIASEAGTVFSIFINRVIPNVRHVYCFHFEELVAVLHTDAVDAVALDMPVALYLAANNKNFAVFPYVVSVDTYGFAVPKGSSLCSRANEALTTLKESGVIDDAEMYWFAADEAGKEKSMPVLTHRPRFNGSAGTIRFGCENTLIPMSYTTPDGKPTGFDIDILYRIAYELNMKVVVKTMHFTELFPALLDGRLDMIGGSMTITEDRKEYVDFIGPYFEGGTALVVKKKNLP